MRKVMVVANPYAGSMSPRRRDVIVKALAADFKLEVVETEHREHAIELGRDAADRDFDAVLAVGGDGTVNEVAQGLVHSDVALGILPAGSTNVMARALGIPRDIVDATAYVGGLLNSGTSRLVNVGRIMDRFFLFCAGMGLDAEVVRRVEADPEGKRAHGEWLFLKNAVVGAFTDYCAHPPKMRLKVEGRDPEDVLLAVCGNARPFTYFRSLPVDACPQARLDGRIDILAFTRMRRSAIPRLAWALLFSGSHIHWKNARYVHEVGRARFEAFAPLPVQVDGDYIGDHSVADVETVPQALNILA